MGLCFAIGSSCFLVGPLPRYAKLVGGDGDELTFFVGSIFFTAGGAIQSWLAWPERNSSAAGRAAWRAAIIQSAGTLFFNVTTFQANQQRPPTSEYNRADGRPQRLGVVPLSL